MQKERGFTLVELMVVIAIIGLLIAIVIPDLMKTKQEAAIEACKASLRGVQSALELYYTHYKYYPEKLDVMVTEGYLSDGNDKDPWDKQFRYQPKQAGEGSTDSSGGGSSSRKAGNYLLGSNGPDNKPDTVDDIEPPLNTKLHSFKEQASGNNTPGSNINQQ